MLRWAEDRITLLAMTGQRPPGPARCWRRPGGRPRSRRSPSLTFRFSRGSSVSPLGGRFPLIVPRWTRRSPQPATMPSTRSPANPLGVTSRMSSSPALTLAGKSCLRGVPVCGPPAQLRPPAARGAPAFAATAAEPAPHWDSRSPLRSKSGDCRLTWFATLSYDDGRRRFHAAVAALRARRDDAVGYHSQGDEVMRGGARERW